jgi:hypothetical protein
MSRIVAARFERSVDADAALEELKRAGFARHEVDSFAVNPPGQHGLHPAGGDSYSDAGARDAGVGAALGALIGLPIGIAAGVMGAIDFGTLSIPLTAALGALVGAFAGAMARLHGASQREATPAHPVEMPAGRMIAVLVERPATEPRAIDILKRHGARDLGRAEGDWRDGSWRDFDPRVPLATV